MSRTNTEKRQEIVRVGGAIDEHDARLIAAAPNLLAALERLSFAAECRDNTMGDACRLIEVKAELASANQQARAAIAKATGDIGQPIRKLLGIGQHDRLTDEQLAQAKAF